MPKQTCNRRKPGMGPGKSDSVTGRAGFRTAAVLALLLVLLGTNPMGYLIGLDDCSNPAYAGPKGDMDRDGDIDIDDLQIFSQKWLGEDWQNVDWCQWIADNPKEARHLDGLYDFIIDYFQCGQPPEPNEPNVPPEDPLAIKNSNGYPTRLAFGPLGYLYVTDARVGSVFIYDPNLVLLGELKGFEKPLGLAIDTDGLIYIGSNRLDNVEVYGLDGRKVKTIGQGRIKMPNDLAFDADGNLHVVDSVSNVVWVYDPNGKLLRNMGNALLDFPVDVDIAYFDDGSGSMVGEVYVGDQGNSRVRVFDLQGNLLRHYGGIPKAGGMMGSTWYWKGRFVKMQSLAVDSLGQVHVADCYMNKVQILERSTGTYVSSYGSYGTEPGKLNVPLDIAIDQYGRVVVANSGNARVEIISPVP